MTDITQMLNELIKSLEPFKVQAKSQVVGYVVKADIYSQLNLNKGAERVLPPLGRLAGIPVYPDLDQQEDCIEFTDAEALKLYLSRRENPEDWARYLVKTIDSK